MLAGGYSWRLFFYVEAAFAAALLVMAFFFVEESTYHRDESGSAHSLHENDEGKASSLQIEDTLAGVVPVRKSFLSTLKPWSAVDHDAEFFMTILRSFTNFFVPAVFWVITTYGKSPGKSRV